MEQLHTYTTINMKHKQQDKYSVHRVSKKTSKIIFVITTLNFHQI